MAKRNFSTQAIILKRKKVGETDRVVFLLSQQKGRFVAIAKGVRKLNSSKRAFMEPGNIIKAELVKTKGLPLLIQAKPIDSIGQVRHNLKHIRQLLQILEIYDKLFVEQAIDDNLYRLLLEIRLDVIQRRAGIKQIQVKLNQLIEGLGFPKANLTQQTSISDYVASLAERPMHSFEYLQVK